MQLAIPDQVHHLTALRQHPRSLVAVYTRVVRSAEDEKTTDVGFALDDDCNDGEVEESVRMRLVAQVMVTFAKMSLMTVRYAEGAAYLDHQMSKCSVDAEAMALCWVGD